VGSSTMARSTARARCQGHRGRWRPAKGPLSTSAIQDQAMGVHPVAQSHVPRTHHAAPSHTQASTASRQAGHATRPRRAPTRARGAERTDDGPHARWPLPARTRMPRPGWRPRSVMGARAAPTRLFQPTPPSSLPHTTTTSPNPQNIITTPQNPSSSPPLLTHSSS
jgi:hypothetical protein